MAPTRETPLLLILTYNLLLLNLLITPSSSATESFVYGGCTQSKYSPGSPYQTAVNSLLTSVVSSATFATYNNFTVPGPTLSDTLYGVFQCRGDVTGGDCSRCVSRAVSQLGSICVGSSGGALQLDGCFVKYDNATFLGVEDKTVVMKKCGPQLGGGGSDADALSRRDSVLGYMQSSAERGAYRVGSSGELKAVAQCVQDLVAGDCQDCLTEAIGRLKTDCAAAKWGDMFLAKCYARYSEGVIHSPTGHGTDENDEEVDKTLAILIGLIAGVALIIVFLSFLAKICSQGTNGMK